MVAGGAEVEYGIEVGCLSGGGQDGCDTPFEFGYLGGYGVVCRVCESGIEIAAFLKVEEAGHLFGCGVFEGGALDDGEHAGLAVFRLPASLHANRACVQIFFHISVIGVSGLRPQHSVEDASLKLLQN